QPVAVTFSGLTIRNGTNGNGLAGGIDIQGAANVTVQNSVVANNFAAFFNGGGINFSFAAGGTLTISNSTFSGNNANDKGGAIYNTGATLTILNSTFSANGSMNSTEGGAIMTFGP